MSARLILIALAALLPFCADAAEAKYPCAQLCEFNLQPTDQKVSVSVLMRNLVPPLSDHQALALREKIISGIRVAAAKVAAQKYYEAISLLNDYRLIGESGFFIYCGPQREHFFKDLSSIKSKNEGEFAWTLIDNLNYKPLISLCDGWGFIRMHHFPRRGDQPLKEYQWAQRQWIRVNSEELLHLAQFLGQMGDEENWFLSEAFKKEHHLVSEADSVGGDKDLNLREGDVYAFLIETFGRPFIPVWYGTNSKYKIRNSVDKYFHY